jgi:predicted aldo/keto reductase-like oxidoreductase
MSNKDRRAFLKQGASALAGAALLPGLLKGKTLGTKEEKKGKMIYRILGKTGLKLPIVSMGVMNADNPNLVKSALERGILHLDTAHGYQRGRNEEMIGKVVKDIPRESFTLATKIYESQDRETGLFLKEATPQTFMEKFEISLKRLQMDYVDILYIHSIKNKEAANYEPFLNLMQKLKKEGKIRFIGLSTHKNEPEVLKAAADSKIYDVVLTAYNFKQKHVSEVEKAIDYAAKAGLGIVAMKTQAGVYWDKEKQQPINMKAALKWALKNNNIHTSIPGFTTFDQMDLDLSVMEDLTLTEEEKKDLKLNEAKTAQTGLFCQQCDACLPQCKGNMDIPTLMRSYMYAYGYNNLEMAKITLDSLGSFKISCNSCSTCEVSCAMGFELKDKIQDIVRLKDVPREFLS